MRSEKAVGSLSFHRGNRRERILEILKKYAEKFHVKIHQSTVNTNHVHLAVEATQKVDLQNFIRTVTGLIARLVTGAKKGANLEGRFWTKLIYSRLLRSGRELWNLWKYIRKNDLESRGLIPYTPRPARRSLVARRS